MKRRFGEKAEFGMLNKYYKTEGGWRGHSDTSQAAAFQDSSPHIMKRQEPTV